MPLVWPPWVPCNKNLPPLNPYAIIFISPVTSSIVARHILPSFIVCRSLHTSRTGRGKFLPPTGSPFHKARNAKPLKGRNVSTGRQFTEEQRSLHSSNQSGLSTSGFPHGTATGTTRDILSKGNLLDVRLAGSPTAVHLAKGYVGLQPT